MSLGALIVDGYNVIRSTDRYRSLADGDLDAARAMLVSDVAAFAQGEHDATVVFDGASNPESDGVAHSVAGVDVIFSPYRQDADSVIETLCGQLRAGDVEVIVVTSDSETQWVVLGQGATRVSALQFASSIGEGEAEMGEYNPSGTKRTTLDRRIDPETRDVLAKWARGEK